MGSECPNFKNKYLFKTEGERLIKNNKKSKNKTKQKKIPFCILFYGKCSSFFIQKEPL